MSGWTASYAVLSAAVLLASAWSTARADMIVLESNVPSIARDTVIQGNTLPILPPGAVVRVRFVGTTRTKLFEGPSSSNPPIGAPRGLGKNN